MVHVNAEQPYAYCGNAVRTTKYTLLTFLPQFLFESFARTAYVYFLLQAVLSFWHTVSPYDPVGATAALSFVLLVAGVKAVVEDAKRAAADRRANQRQTEVLRAGGDDGAAFVRVPWRDVRVGDIVRVADGEEVPADLICLHAGGAGGVAYVQTTSLDGESNLKLRHPPAGIALGDATAHEAAALRAVLQLDAPNAELHRLNGRIDVLAPPPDADRAALLAPPVPPRSVPLTLEHALLRGCVLRNSRAVLGVAVYTGPETRIQMNSRRAPRKAAAYDRFLDAQVAALVVAQVALCAACAGASLAWRRANVDRAWYLELRSADHDNYRSPAAFFCLHFLTFWVLYSYLVPISLYVSMEIVKFLQGALFIDRDTAMRDPATGEFAAARNTNLNEDLGMVSHVFSDKTGTLTANEMRLRQLCVGGVTFGDPAWDAPRGFRLEEQPPGLPPSEALRGFDDRLARLLLPPPGADASFDDLDLSAPAAAPPQTASAAELAALARDAFGVLTLCHSLFVEHVLPDDGGGGTAAPAYQGPSPDEVALAEGAAALGFSLEERTAGSLAVRELGRGARYELLATLAFTSERQRMSVVVRSEDGRVRLLCKGADAAVLPLLAPPRDAREAVARRATAAALRDMASRGLRTMVLAARDLSEADWAAWQEAAHCGGDAAARAECEVACAAAAESALTLVGATGLQDKLQDGVPETVALLLAARIAVWVITGDKRETAVSVATACGLLADPSRRLGLGPDADAGGAALRELRAQMESGEAAELVVDGRALAPVLRDAALTAEFAAAAVRARAVVVCRASPRQKAAVLRAVRAHMRGGGGDAARAGTAARLWDLAARELNGRLLQCDKLLAIGDGANDVAMIVSADVGVGIVGREGRQAANSADYSVGQFRHLARLLLLHGTLSRYRLARLIKYSFFKNVAFAALLFYYQFYAAFSGEALYDSVSAAVFNVVLTSLPVLAFALFDQPVSPRTLMTMPRLYNSARSLSLGAFWRSVAGGAAAAALCFWLTIGCIARGAPAAAKDVLGKAMFTAVLLVVTAEIALAARCWTAPFAGTLVFSVGVWLPILVLVPHAVNYLPFQGVAGPLLSSGPVWLLWLLAPTAWVALRCAGLGLGRQLRPNDFDVAAEMEAAARARGEAITEPRAVSRGGVALQTFSAAAAAAT